MNDVENISIGIRARYTGFSGMSALQADLARIRKAFDGGTAGQKVTAVASGLGTLSIGFGATAVAAEAWAAKAATAYNKALTQTQAFTTASQKDMQRYNTAIMQMSQTYGYSATKMAEGLYNITSASIQGTKAIQSLRYSTEFSAASQTDMSTTTNLATTAISAYGNKLGSVKGMFDDLTQAIKLGKMEPAEYAANLGRVLAIAPKLNVDLKTIGAVFATLTNRGFTPGVVNEDFGHLLESFSAPTTKMMNAAQALGVNPYQLFDIKNRGLPAVLAQLAQLEQNGPLSQTQIEARTHLAPRAAYNLARQMDVPGGLGILQALLGDRTNAQMVRSLTSGPMFSQMNAGMQNDRGALDQSYAKSNKAPYRVQERLQAAAERLRIQIGNAELPMIVSLEKAILPVVNAMSQWAQAHQSVIAGAARLAPVLIGVGAGLKLIGTAASLVTGGFRVLAFLLGPAARALMLLIGTVRELGSVMFALNLVMDANPIGLITLAVIALGAAFVLAYSHISGFRTGINRLMSGLVYVFQHPIDAAKDMLQWFQDHWAMGLLLLLTGPFVAFPLFILHTFFPQVYANLQATLDQIQGWLQGAWTSTIYNNLLKPFAGVPGQIFNIGKDILLKLVDGLKAGYALLPGPIQAIVNKITGGFGSLAKWAWNEGSAISTNIANGISSAASKITNAVSGAVNSAYTAGSGPATPNSANWGSGNGQGYNAPGAPLLNYVPSGSMFGQRTGYSFPYVSDKVYGKSIGGSGGYTVGFPMYGGGGTVVADVDYGTGSQFGHSVTLPGGKQYSYKVLYAGFVPKVGYVVSVRDPSGGTEGFQHLSTIQPYVKVGASLAGGTVIGGSGFPALSPNQYSGLGSRADGGNSYYSPTNSHLCVIYDAQGGSWLFDLQTGKVVAKVGQRVPKTSQVTPSGVNYTMPTYTPSSSSATDHTGQPGWYFNGTKWVHVSKPTNSRYAWDAADHTWVLSSKWSKILGLQKLQTGERDELSTDRSLWTGVNPLTLPWKAKNHFDQMSWLHDQYRMAQDQRALNDQKFMIQFLQGQISYQKLLQFEAKDRMAADRRDQWAWGKLHPGAGGAANHVQSVRMVDSCPEEAKANQHRKTTAQASQETSKNTGGIWDEVKGLRREFHSLTAAMAEIAHEIKKGGHAAGGDSFNGISMLPANGG